VYKQTNKSQFQSLYCTKLQFITACSVLSFVQFVRCVYLIYRYPTT